MSAPVEGAPEGGPPAAAGPSGRPPRAAAPPRAVRPTALQWLELLGIAALLAWSGLAPHDRAVWAMETLPVLLALVAVCWRWRTFPWTSLATLLMALFAVVLCVGGHYTYTLVPLGQWVSEALELQRNHYDRLGHLLQGVAPAMLVRELLLRRTLLPRGKGLYWIVVSITLAISATFELIEWWLAMAVAPEQGIAYLGSQGDAWDAQWDMSAALCGALLVQLVLARPHDRQLEALARATGERAPP